MSLQLYSLRKYGITENNIQILHENKITLIDLIADSPKVMKIGNETLRKAAFVKIKQASNDFIRECDDYLNAFDQIEMLAAFGLKKLDFLIQRNITSIKVAKLDFDKYKLSEESPYTLANRRHFDESYSKYQSELLKVPLEETDKWRLFSILLLTSGMSHQRLERVSGVNDFNELIKQMIKEKLILIDDGLYYAATEDNKKLLSFRERFINEELEKKLGREILENPRGKIKSFRNEATYPKLNEILKQMDFDEDGILKMRLQGLSLEEVGKKFDVTRERIRQKQTKLIKLLPYLQEDGIYKEIYEKFNITLSQFTLVFEEQNSESIYNYLKIRYNSGNDDFLEWIIQSGLSRLEKFQLFKDNKKILSFEGEIKSLVRGTIINEVLFANRKTYKYLNEELFNEAYHTYLQKNDITEFAAENTTSLMNSAIVSDYCISSKGNQFRFHDNHLTEEEINKILLKVDGLEDGIYSMRKIFDENKDLMKEIDIKDAYELHNLFKRYVKVPINMKLTRAPEFQVGDTAKYDFYLEKIMEQSGVLVETYANNIQREYGLPAQTTQSYLSMNFQKYIFKNRIESNIQLPTNQMFYEKMKDSLTENIYLLSTVKKIKEKLGYENNLTQLLMNELGFMIRGNFVIRKIYSNTKQAFLGEILKSPSYKITGTDIQKTMEFYNYEKELEEDFQVIRSSENELLPVKFLEKNGFEKSILEEFSKSVYDFVEPETYFTLPNLMKSGFNHDFLDYGFDDITYERIIFCCLGISIISKKGSYLFKKTENSEIILNDFFISELEAVKSIDAFAFIEDINQKYNMRFDMNDVKHRIINQGAYYSQALKKFYIDKNDYLDEVYGK